MPKTIQETSSAATRLQDGPVTVRRDARLPGPKLPTLQRTDIKFWNLDAGRIRVGITLHNPSDQPTEATQICIATAPLGAFVPWRPLASLQIPVLAPGESREVATVAEYIRPQSLGQPSQVTPDALKTAVATAEHGGQSRQSLLEFIRARLLSDRSLPPVRGVESVFLARDPLHALEYGSVYWAGNLNVFIGRQSVERHRAAALRVYRECENRAVFFVGEGYDAYSFRIAGDVEDWEPELINLSSCPHLAVAREDADLIHEGEWCVTHDQLVVGLTMWPPATCRDGALVVDVTQHSTGKTVQVEFDLSPRAQGAGCYTV